MQLSGNIRSLRKERSLTQEQLAQALGVTAGAVYKWEAGLSTPDVSLIVELADFFDTSVDVLLGYKVRGNKREAAAARVKDCVYRRDARGLAEAEKLLIRYPNCFEIVYTSADLYWLFGFAGRNQTQLRRCIELMERACLLIGQNTDPEISELSIQYSIAKAWFALGECEKAVQLLLGGNPRGVHNDFIGYLLAAHCARPEEALPYLSRALLRCATSLDYVALGYSSACFMRKDFHTAAGVLRMALDFFAHLKKPGQNNYLDKASVQLYVYLAAAQVGLGDRPGAQDTLRTAGTLAEQFDRAPDYSGGSLRFVAFDRPSSAFDDLGDTAMDCLRNTLDTCKNDTLLALWEEIAAEEPWP